MQKSTNSIIRSKVLFYCISFLCGLFILPQLLLASTTQGIVTSGSQYAWGENIGWVNFAPSLSGQYTGLTITDSSITGYAWSSALGWINFSPTNSGQGVLNDGEGNLSGSAWISGLGWLPMNGVIINANGKFTGTTGVASTTVGRLSFDCNHCEVLTDWRKASQRQTNSTSTPVTNSNTSGPTGGGSVSAANTSVNNSGNTTTNVNNSRIPDGVISSPGATLMQASLQTGLPAQNNQPVINAVTTVEKNNSGDKIFNLVQKDGLKVVVIIPEGAVDSEDISVSITPEFLHELNAPNPEAQVFLVNGNIFNIEARGANGQAIRKFKKDIIISIDIPKNMAQDKDLRAFYLDESIVPNPKWINIPNAETVDGKVIFRVDHLTRFAIFKGDVSNKIISTGVNSSNPADNSKLNFVWLTFAIVLILIAGYRFYKNKADSKS